MQEVVSLVILGTLASKMVDFFKYLRVKDWNATTTQLAVWVAGVFVIVLGANSDAFDAILIPGMDRPMGDLNIWALVLVGMTLTSFVSFTYDFRKAFDNTDSARMPQLTDFQLADGKVGQ